MPIIYSLIGRIEPSSQIVTLCSYDACVGNYPTITQSVLKDLKIKDVQSLKYDQQYVYNIKKDGNLLILCLNDTTVKIKTALVFLQEIKKKFIQKYDKDSILTARAFQFNATFSQIFKQQFTFFNNNKDIDKKDELVKKLQNLQEAVNDNVLKVMQREQKVEMLIKKAQKNETISMDTKNRATRLKKQAFWQKNKCKLMIGGLLLAGACGFVFII